jgi:hypothetical protein
MPRFTAIPSIPTANVVEWQGQIMSSLKENVELLAGIRGEADLASRAITGDRVKVKIFDAPTFARVTATGAGYNVSGVDVAALSDHAKLITDVQTLANDVAIIRQLLNALISQVKG